MIPIHMDTKVMLVDFDDKFFVGVAKDLARTGIKIPFAITSNPSAYKEDVGLKHTKVFDPFIFSFPKLIRKLNIHNHEGLSTEIIKDFVDCENLYLTITDRLNFFPLPIKERKNAYQQLLLYWYSFFKKNPIDAIIFTATPHMGNDNIIYCVAKKLNVKTFYIQRTLMENRILVPDDYRKINKVPAGYLKDEKKEKIIDIIGKDLYNTLYGRSAWIKRSDHVNQKAMNKSLLFALKEYLAVFFRFLRFLFQGKPTSVFYLNDGCNKFIIGFICLYMNLKVRNLRNYYSKKCTKVNWKNKFVYFPLHFQPEKSTLPEGGIFENQLLVIDILSKSVPKGWVIYVKEHPRQFEKNDPRRRHFRDSKYYDQILSHKNVRLIKIEEDSQQLLEKAVFTVTVTGSSGWQSLLKGKPCLVFGNPWYSGCNTCYTVGSIKECQEAIADIAKKKRSQVEMDVLKYLAYYKNRFVISTNDYMFVPQSRIPYSTLVNNLANRLYKLLQT